MVCQCHQLQLCHFALGVTWRALSAEVHHIFSQSEKNGGKCVLKIKRLYCGRAGCCRLYRYICERLQMHTALQLALQYFLEVWFPKVDKEYGQSQDLEKINRFICSSMYFLFSVSLPLSLLLPLSYMHIHTHTHTQLRSAKTPMGESVWLLEMSNCFVTSNLSQGA